MARGRRRAVLMKEAAKGSKDVDLDELIKEEEHGVWSLCTLRSAPTGVPMADRLKQLRKLAPVAVRVVKDIYILSPYIVLVLTGVWLLESMRSAISIHFSSDLIRGIEKGHKENVPILNIVVRSVLLKAVYTLVSGQIVRFGNEIQGKLGRKFKLRFDLKVMEATLGGDKTSGEPIPTDINPNAVWQAFDAVRMEATGIFKSIFEVMVVFRMIKSSKLALFLMVVRPIIDDIIRPVFGSRATLAYSKNLDYIRLKAMRLFGRGEYSEEVVYNGLVGWIIKEYGEASTRLDGIELEFPFMRAQSTPALSALMAFLDDLPLAASLLTSVSEGTPFSVANAAILQSSMHTLRTGISRFLDKGAQEYLVTYLLEAQKLYEFVDSREASLKQEGLAYPASSSEDNSRGMGFNIEDVSFSYPGNDATQALKGINLTIPPGSLVVIVGANGSGKSTLVRLLAGFHKPSEGRILVDGHPYQDYKASDVRKASVILHQDAKVYPVSLAENIGLGHVEMKDNFDLIKESAQQGGAAAFISKLKDQYETTLESLVDVSTTGVPYGGDHPLFKKWMQLRMVTDISGGERQRLIASRSFMRLKTGNIKFIAVDEPTSALDAEGELHLFNELLAARQGKTLVFVTHRFGHLTKHADIVITLKDGELIEVGTHNELIDQNGEYAKLYNVQASAFK